MKTTKHGINEQEMELVRLLRIIPCCNQRIVVDGVHSHSNIYQR